MTISINTLFTVETADRILSTGLELAAALGLTPTSWRTGDPTKALFKFVAEVLAARDTVSARYIKAGFLSTATGDWKTVVAAEVYNVTRQEATYATSTITVNNTGGGLYPLEPGELTVRSSTSDKTYHNTASVTINPSETGVEIEVAADEAGSGSSAGTDEIDELVTSLLGVAIVSSTVAIGVDEQDDDSLEEQCLDSLGALSPNGPPDAYEYVVTNSELTGVTEITRAATVADSDTGEVTVFVAGAAGAVSGASVTAAQTAVGLWAEPLTIEATVSNSTEVAQAITMTVSGDDIQATYAADIEALLAILFSSVAISGLLSRSAIISLAQVYLIEGGASRISVALTVPASNVSLDDGEVVTLGAVSVTEV